MIKTKEVPNKHNCMKGLWKKFGPSGRIAYNEVRDSYNPANFLHPISVKKLTKKEWDTISHNMACIVAWQVKEITKKAALLISEL